MNKEFKQILEETGSNNVRNIRYDADLDKWFIDYKSTFRSDKFSLFDDLYGFLKTENAENYEE